MGKTSQQRGGQVEVPFRLPTSAAASSSLVSLFTTPSPELLSGTWRVYYSTLPLWKSNRNITITYTPHQHISGAWDSVVKYQALSSHQWKTVKGVERADVSIPAAWNWRGKGWLVIASSHWEVLGYGDSDGGWCVIWFAKTLFTPAGLDVLCRHKKGVSDDTLAMIKAQLHKLNDDGLARLVDNLFRAKQDGS